VRGKSRNNIVADEVTLNRHHPDTVGRCPPFHMFRVTEVCTQTAVAFGASCEVQIHPSYPVLVNDEQATELVRNTP